MIDISVDWPNTKKFALANINYMYVHYRTLEFADPLRFMVTVTLSVL